jgi:predicted flap endonuclease-1-like 5' DNA nuclease
MASKEAGEEVKKLTDEVSKEATTAARRSAPKKTTGAASKAKSSTSKPMDKSDLTLIKGIGPATAKKMKNAGITSIDQIANPSAEDQEKLKAFSNIKGYSEFAAEAKKIS